MLNLARGGKKLFLLLPIFCCFYGGLASTAYAKKLPILRIVGSSAMYPFLTAVSERFGYEGETSVPVVEATGTGGGIKFFCASADPFSPSLVAASRPMSEKEKAFCRRNGVDFFHEIPLGLDGIVLVEPQSSRGSFLSQKNQDDDESPQEEKSLISNITLKNLFKAVAHPEGAHKKELPHYWSDISKSYPQVPIKILAPSTSSGTREAFENLVLKGVQSRQGRAFKSAADQEAVLVQKLLKTHKGIGILSFAYLEKNKETLQPLSLDGVIPTRKTIREKKYPLVRKVFIYVKGGHLANHPFLKSFVRYLISPEMNQVLAENGLIPFKEKKQIKRHKAVMNFMSSAIDRRNQAL